MILSWHSMLTPDYEQGGGSCKHGHNIPGGLSPVGVKHSHSMRDQTSHMREKYQARYQHRRLSIRTPTASNNNTPKVVGGTNSRGNLPGWLVKVRNLRKKNVQIWCFLGNLAGFYVSNFFIFICGGSDWYFADFVIGSWVSFLQLFSKYTRLGI